MPTETTPAPTLVERLQNVRCDRQPFTAEHKLCICRLTNKAAAEIERLSRELLEAKEFERKACLGIAERWMICEAIGATNVAREIAVAIRARSVLSPNKDSETEVSRERETG